jgi:hypothetical protein
VTEKFFERPILNSPYAYPDRHWELDADGQPTNHLLETRAGLSSLRLSNLRGNSEKASSVGAASVTSDDANQAELFVTIVAVLSWQQQSFSPHQAFIGRFDEEGHGHAR